jgi:hypothetical protein
VEVCPVDCIVPGKQDDPDWGKYFIFEEDDVPSEYEADIKMNYAYFESGPGYWEYDLEEERNPVRD